MQAVDSSETSALPTRLKRLSAIRPTISNCNCEIPPNPSSWQAHSEISESCCDSERQFISSVHIKGTRSAALHFSNRAILHCVTAPAAVVNKCKVAVDNYRLQRVGEKFWHQLHISCCLHITFVLFNNTMSIIFRPSNYAYSSDW